MKKCTVCGDDCHTILMIYSRAPGETLCHRCVQAVNIRTIKGEYIVDAIRAERKRRQKKKENKEARDQYDFSGE